MKIIIFCLIAITLVSSTYFASAQYTCQGTALCISGKVTKIVDGDTIYLKDYKIRLSLTNTPEKGEIGFKEATSFTKKLCPIGSTITVDQDDKQKKDAYGRVLGKVICSGKVLNSELLYNGHANILKQYCSKSEFSGEAWAQKYGCATKTQELKQQIPKQSQTPTATTKDSDFDGIPDDKDQCIYQKETLNGYKDADGCPDEIPKESQTPTQSPTTKDSDFDRIPDSSDACPSQAENFNGYQDTDGCPDTPPPVDSDGDGIYDSSDACVYSAENYNSYQDADGCPDEIPKESQTPTTSENQCDPSYPDVCIPPYPPDLDCGDIPYKNFRVLPPDPHGFDRDKDGIGCEK